MILIPRPPRHSTVPCDYCHVWSEVHWYTAEDHRGSRTMWICDACIFALGLRW